MRTPQSIRVAALTLAAAPLLFLSSCGSTKGPRTVALDELDPIRGTAALAAHPQASSYVGSSFLDAVDQAEAAGLDWAAIERDGKNFAAPDPAPNQILFKIVNDKVTAAFSN